MLLKRSHAQRAKTMKLVNFDPNKLLNCIPLSKSERKVKLQAEGGFCKGAELAWGETVTRIATPSIGFLFKQA